ncbi:alpha/beta hydrolase family protein [Effusibacillus lacus]|uniref:Peptidase S9 n=1 Tax=Effusibacillus lacus TaxID=1348429 RepID=A0A292YCS2_9BACL|nr:prolyl oligopeptidase family serine peptidase [Effusibacillus lacus]TCS73657.1 prolyl oligopeptidase family protein [Effusibacillus lacus]GAX89452.1 peptidase S9 [Effusibacillus lacus]
MIYHVTYLSDGLKVKGYLGLPNGYELHISELQGMISRFYGSSDLPVTEIASSISQEKKDIRLFKLPVLLYCRGGIGKFGRVKTDWIEQFADYGYVIFAPSYRGNEGGEGRDEFGGSDKEDVLSAYRLLQNLSFVNPERISVMGFSRGAINATLTAVEIPAVHRLILWNGVTDLAQTYEERIDLRRMLKRVLGGSPAKKPGSYQSRSPLLMANRIRCPVLIMHGSEDRQVDFSHGLNMYKKLKELGGNVDMHFYRGYGHHFPPPIHEAAVERMFGWIGH